ncbi:MAG: cobalamin biosynthesis protein [Pseudonocardia sp.]|nr:cobalamin biosynthesis protein [Pseudonocardia sp.]
MTLALGIGARRGVGAAAVRALLTAVAAEHGLDLAGAVFASVEGKDEAGILQAIAPAELRLFPASVLAAVSVPSPSDRVLAAVGTSGVAEAAALLAAGPGAELIVPKTPGDGVTVAVASSRAGRQHASGLTLPDPPDGFRPPDLRR